MFTRYLNHHRLLTVGLTIFLSSAFADTRPELKSDTGPDASVISEEVVVTATRSPYAIAQVANTVRVIDRATIERSGARNIADLLRSYSVVQIHDSLGNGRDARLSLRGYSAVSNALVLVDGRKLNNSDLGGQDLTAVSIADIERVEILEGGAGALYGDQAVGGVINIITTDGRASAGDGGSNRGGQIALGRGSYDNDNYALSYGSRRDNGWFYRFNSELERGDGYRDDSSVNYENFSGKLGYHYGDGSVFVEARDSDNEYRLTGALLSAQVADDRRQAGSSFNDYAADNRTIRLGVDHRFSDEVQLLAAYSDRDEDVVIDASSSFGDTTTLQSRRVKTFDPRLILALDRWHLTVGVDVERVDYDFAIDFGFGLSASAHENRKRGEYAHLLYTVSDALTLQAGIRHTRLDTSIEPFAIAYEQSATAHHLGAVWARDGWRIYLNRDETFRFPLADENVDFFGVVGLLDVQRGIAWELGGERRWRQLETRLVLFQQQNSDEIGFDPALGLFGANTNFDDTRRRGATFELAWLGEDRWSARGLFSYIDARFAEGVYNDRRVPNVAREMARAQVNYQWSAALGVSVEVVHTGSQTIDLANSAGGLGSYTIANLVTAYRVDDWTVRIRLNNIMAKEYTEFVTFYGTRALYPSPERNLMLTLSYDF